MSVRRKRLKLRTIRSQILAPFMGIAIFLPAMIIVIFNIVINLYIDRTTKTELITTRNTAYSLMNAALEEKKTEMPDIEKHSVIDTAKLMVSALTASRLSGNTEFILVYQGRVVYPKDFRNSFISYSDTQKLNIAGIPTDGNIYIRKIEGVTYYLTATKLEKFKDFPTVTMLFVSNTESFDDMILLLNIWLLITMLIVVAFAIYVFARISKKISSPITSAADMAIKIGNGQFVEVPVFDSSDEILRLSTSLNDMSGRLRQAERVQKEFLQNASHELRTPLMSIHGYAEGIENKIVADPISAANIIKQESIRMKKLVDELLTLSRIENQSNSMELKPVNITHLMLDFIQNINGMAMKENIRIDTHMETHVVAYVDETLLSQVVLNIISNCIRYAKTYVFVSAKIEGDKAIITIMDDGDGFDKDDLGHIFDKFYKGKNGNFGLGLSIAASATQYMHGKLTALNADEGGAKFCIELRTDISDIRLS